jgi:hypothetical protein
VTPQQKVAMGLVVVLVDPLFGGWDGVPDPLGWLLVLAGLWALRDRLPTATLLGTAAVAAAVSLATYPPAVQDLLAPSAGWLLSLPQAAVGILLCGALAPLAPEYGGRLRVLRWVLVAVALAPAPVLATGDPDPRAVTVTAGVAVLAQVYLVWLLFRMARHPLDGRPAVPATTQPGTDA